VKDIDDDDSIDELFSGKNGVLLDVLTHNGRKINVSMAIGQNIQDLPFSRIITTSKGNKFGYLYLESFSNGQILLGLMPVV